MQTFVVDFRQNPLGEESFASAMLYPMRAKGHLRRMNAPRGYTNRAELRRVTRNLHVHLQRNHTESEQWRLVVLLDQNTEKDPAWGSLSHQIHALRAHTLTPLDESYNQRPTIILGILPDHWDRRTKTQIPTSPECFLQWSIDRFGMLRLNSLQELEDSDPMSKAALSRYPHLLTEADQPSFTDSSASDVRNFFEDKIKACESFQDRLKEQFDVFPPVCIPRELVGIRDALLDHLNQPEDERTLGAVFQEQAKKRLSALAETLHRQRRDLVLLRMPVSREPLPRRKRDLMRLDYVQGAFSLPHDLRLRDSLLSDDDDTFAYWFGTRKNPGESSRIHQSDDDLCDSVQRNLALLEDVKSSLDLETLGSYQLELFEPFDHSCDLKDSDDWEDAVEQLNQFPFFRPAVPRGEWSNWVEEIDQLVNQKYNRLSSKLSDCLTEARKEWKDQPTRIEEGEEIERKVAELESSFKKQRRNVVEESSEGFVNDWEERADALADSIRQALKLRPTKQQFTWTCGSVLGLLVLLTGTVTGFPLGAWPIGFWGVVSLLLGTLGLFLARKRLVSQIEQETQRATTEAENVVDELHTFIQSREGTIENYFKTLATRKNLERARRAQSEIEAERLRHRHHQQSLMEHADETSALRDFLGCSATDRHNDTFDIIERLDAPAFCSPVYALKRPNKSTTEVFGKEKDTDLLPGLQEITKDPDPAFQVSEDPVSSE